MSEFKRMKVSPYIIFEDICVQRKILSKEYEKQLIIVHFCKVLENKTVFGQGKGTISTEDNQSSIKWSSYDANLVKGGYPGYRGIIYFNSTIDDKFAFLNNTVGIYESDSDTVRSIWLWE